MGSVAKQQPRNSQEPHSLIQSSLLQPKLIITSKMSPNLLTLEASKS